MALAPLRKKRATDEVYESLRTAILTHYFTPGQRLLADELCSQLGVSLTPVRHALQQLAVEGLVEIHPRSGTYVATVSAEDLAETFEIRLALETLAGRRALARWTPNASTRLHDLLTALARPVRNADAMRQHEERNLEFHLALFDIAASRRLRELYQSLNTHIQIARIHSAEGPGTAGLRDRLTQEQKEHEAIVQALEQGSAAKLESALRTHIERAQASLLAALGARQLQLPAHQPPKHQKRQRV
ncbi:MAG: GntR family transcriptional regulator [Acidobacteriota bacterium]